MQFMERQGDMEGARKHYEAAGCGLVEVPRMLFEAEKFTELQNYIQVRQRQRSATAGYGRGPFEQLGGAGAWARRELGRYECFAAGQPGASNGCAVLERERARHADTPRSCSVAIRTASSRPTFSTLTPGFCPPLRTRRTNAPQANDSRELILWWGKYLESLGEYAKALDCYRKAGDSLSMVRIHCFQRDWKAAEDEVRAPAPVCRWPGARRGRQSYARRGVYWEPAVAV